MNTKEFITKYFEETNEIMRDIDKGEIEKSVDILFEAWKTGKTVFTLGNGGSASTASHFAADLAKTVVNPSSEKEISSVQGFKTLCLNDNPANMTAWINDCGWDKVYAGQLNTLLEEGDIILILSVHGGSGWSGNIVRAMETAKAKKAKIIGLAGFDGGMLKKMADACMVVPKDSTPHTEGFHSVLQHLIIFRLKELVEAYQKNQSLIQLQEIQKNSPESIKPKIQQLINEFNLK